MTNTSKNVVSRKACLVCLANNSRPVTGITADPYIRPFSTLYAMCCKLFLITELISFFDAVFVTKRFAVSPKILQIFKMQKKQFFQISRFEYCLDEYQPVIWFSANLNYSNTKFYNEKT